MCTRADERGTRPGAHGGVLLRPALPPPSSGRDPLRGGRHSSADPLDEHRSETVACTSAYATEVASVRSRAPRSRRAPHASSPRRRQGRCDHPEAPTRPSELHRDADRPQDRRAGCCQPPDSRPLANRRQPSPEPFAERRSPLDPAATPLPRGALKSTRAATTRTLSPSCCARIRVASTRDRRFSV